MIVRRAFGTAAILLGGVLVTGCASGRTADVVGQASASRQPRQVSLGRTVEGADSRLAAALLVEATLPTAESHLRVANEYRRLGVLDAAFERLTQAVRKAPRLARAHEAIARAWRDWNQPERALGAAYRAAFFARDSAAAQNTLGTVLDALGQLGDARDAYSRAIFIDPTAAWALNNMCYVEFRLGLLRDAALQCDAALRLEPDLAAAHNNLALVHAASGDLVGARTEFLAVGDLAAGHYNVGIVYLAAGDHRSAAEAFEEAIKARPTFTAAKTRAHAARLRLLTGSD